MPGDHAVGKVAAAAQHSKTSFYCGTVCNDGGHS